MCTISMQAELHYNTYMSSIAALLAFLYVGVSDTGSPLSKEAMQTAFSCFCKEGRVGMVMCCGYVCGVCMHTAVHQWWAIIISGT